MIHLKTIEEIEKIRAAGQILAEVSKIVRNMAGEGVSLLDLDTGAREAIEKWGAKPSFLGYKPYGAKKAYPASICASLNDVVVHGVPTAYKLKNGDLLKLDFGVLFDGYHADAAWTLMIGGPKHFATHAKELVVTTEKALHAAIAVAKPGNTLGDIGHTIESIVTHAGFSIVDGLTGHGVGKQLHEDPYVHNKGIPGKGIKLIPGMVLAIEPMTSMGKSAIRQTKDDAYASKDGSLTAHFEHTIAITENGPEILTLSS